MVENCSLVAFADLLAGINFQVVHIFFLWIVVWKLVWSARMSPMKNLSANSNQVDFTCTSFMQLQKQVIDKCKKKQFLKLEHKDVDFLKSIFLSEGTN